MIKKTMTKAFNKQINEEVYSSYLYLSMAAYFDSVSLGGFSHWLKLQAQEEMFHAMKFYHHIVERGGEVELDAIAKPDLTWASPLAAYEAALNHEYHISKCINDLMELAQKEKDFAAQNLLNWFVEEQVEEEASFTDVVDQLKMIGDKSHALLQFNKEMGQRVPGENPFAPAPSEE